MFAKERSQIPTPLLGKRKIPQYLQPFSTSGNRYSKNVIIAAIIVPELELRNVKMQVFLAHAMECADDIAFEDASEALTRICVHRATR